MSKSQNKNGVSVGALFSGIGGFCIGFDEAGAPTSWAVDIDEQATTTYRFNFQKPNTLTGDVSQLHGNADELQPVDILHAGFPCQSFSQAGDRAGFADPRGMLFFEIMRLLEEWGNDKPKILVLENIPYLMIGDGGQWFDRIRLAIQRAGYWFSSDSCFVLDTYEVTDLPQKRSRLFMIATNRDYFSHNCLEIEGIDEPPEKPKLESFLEPEGEVDERYFLPSDNRYSELILKHVQPDDGRRLYQLRKYVVRRQEPDICPTLTANMGNGGHNVPFLLDGGRVRKLTERECLRLQGFPASFKFPKGMSHGPMYRLIGNSVSPKVSSLIAKSVLNLIAEEAQ